MSQYGKVEYWEERYTKYMKIKFNLIIVIATLIHLIGTRDFLG